MNMGINRAKPADLLSLTEGSVSVLFVPFGTVRVAATRHRIYLYLPYLDTRGVHYRIFSLISDWTTRQMINSPRFNGPRKALYYLQVTLEKIIRFVPILYLAGRYKVVFLQRSTLPALLARLLKKRNKNIIFDLDDAIFIPDHQEEGLLARVKERTKAAQVACILKLSKAAIVENDYIGDYVRQYCPKIYLIPGPIDTLRNSVRPKRDSGQLVIGWIGSPSTSIYLELLHGVFRQIARRYKVVIKLIGAGNYQIPGVDLVNSDWAIDREVTDLQSFDIGLMPMPDTEWTRGKLGCKMLQYMSVGVPTLASYTSTNEGVICDGINGFLARSVAEWVKKLSLLIEDQALREKIGLNGRKTAEVRFSVEVNAPKFLGALINTAQKDR